MNRHKIVWGAALIALLGLILGGCSKELGRRGNEEVPGVPEKGQAVTFTVTTGVETYAVPAQDYEKSISTLQAILFDGNGVYVTSGTPVPTAQGSTSYTLPIATTGSYKMLLVANCTIPAGSLTGKSLSDVRAILVDNEPGMPNAFVMASTTIPDFTVTTGAMSDAGTINLERLAARIDVQSTLDKLTLSKITVKNRKTQSSLLAASSTDAYRTDGKEYGSFERFRKSATDASMGQIYAYENSAASASSADGTSLVIETAYAGVAVKPLEVKLPQLKRNYIYSVQLMMGDEGYVPDPSDNPDPSKIKLTYNVRVVDWNNGQTFVVSENELLEMFGGGVDHSALKYNPLAYVAKWNVTSSGEWDKAHTIPASKDDRNVLMDWNLAKSKYANPQSIQGSTETFLLPSREAWQGIVKYTGYPQLFGSGEVLYNETEEVEVAGQKFLATGDYKPTTMTVNGSSVKCNVALRFNGGRTLEDQYRSAWLYYWGSDVVNGKSVNGLWIYCVNISGRQDISTVDNLDQAFWDQSLSSAVVRFFPAAGHSDGRQGWYCCYWSATEYYSGGAYGMYCISNDVSVGHTDSTPYAFAVRLFADRPLD
ncbi:fimbrial protein [uncultured Porphyromonas sp.]|uniref:fimbrial protein n=1 Tax=uncultured Porphyromonas sp. TaxID=159274 RepID=UPI0026048634|nr:fimbrial protein [uncultured Porphyromonas sp.]